MDADAMAGEQEDLCPGILQSDIQAAVVQTTNPDTAIHAQAALMQPPKEKGTASSNEKEQQTDAPCPGGSKVALEAELDHIKVSDSSNRNHEESQTEDVVHLPIMNSGSKKMSNTPVKFTDIVAALQSNTNSVYLKKQSSSGSMTTKVALYMGGSTYLVVSSLPDSFEVNTILEHSMTSANSTQSASRPQTRSPKPTTSSLMQQTLSSPLKPQCKKVVESRELLAQVKNKPVKATKTSECGGNLPYPNCREICLDLNVRMQQREKLDVKLLTNGIVKEVYSYAQKVTSAFPYVAFQTLEDNFDLCLESDLRKKFCTALSDDLISQVRKNGLNMKTRQGLFEVYKLPEVKRTVHPPISKYARRRLSKDVDPSVAVRREMERVRRLKKLKWQRSLEWLEEYSRQFKTALEKMNSFLTTWVYPDREVVQLPSEKACSERNTTPCTEMTTACQNNNLGEMDMQCEPGDSLPVTHGPATEETPAMEAVVAECAVKTPMAAQETVSLDIATRDVSPQAPIDCAPHLILLEHVKRENDSVEDMTETHKAVDNHFEREGNIKESADVCIKEEPDTYSISLQQIKTEPTIGVNEMLEPTQGLNIVCIKNEPEEAKPEMKVPVRDLEKHSKKFRKNKKKRVPKRTPENPYPLCRKIGLQLGVTADESKQRKLDLKLLTNGVMLEIHDFAKDICASSKQIVMNIFAHKFDLDSQSKQSLHSDNLWLRVKQVMTKQKNLKDKTKFFKEVFTLTEQAGTEKPKQKTDKPKKMVEVLPKFQRWKEMSQKRRQDVQKKKEERVIPCATEDERAAKKSKRYENAYRGETAWGVRSGPQTSSLGLQSLQHMIHEEHLYTMPIDEITACNIEMEATDHITKQGPNLQAGLCSVSADSHVHTFRKMIQDILAVYMQGTDQKSIFAKLLSCVGDSAAPERKLEQILADYRSDVLPHMVEEYEVYTDTERVSLACVNELFYGLHLIDCLAHQAKATLLVWEKMIFEEKEGGDSLLPSTGLTKLESRTVQLVRTVSEAVHGKGIAKDETFTKFSTFLTSKGEFDEIPLAQPRGNRIDAICDNAAGMYSVYSDLMEFANDHMNDSSLIERVHAELQVQHIKAACRALGFISRFVLDPLWKALTLEGSAWKMTERYQVLISKLKVWQMNGRQIVEENSSLFDDIEMPKDLVFERLTTWTDQEIFELTTQVVELLLASFHRICSKMLSSNPEYYRNILADELSEKVRAMATKNPSFQKDVALLGQLQKAHSGALETALEIMVMFQKCRTWEWLPSLDAQKQETVLRSLKQAKQEQACHSDSTVVKQMYLKRKADGALPQNMDQTFEPGTQGQNPPADGLVIMDWRFPWRHRRITDMEVQCDEH